MSAQGDRSGRGIGLWGGLFLATAAAIFGLKASGAIEGGAVYILAIVPTAMLIPLFRAIQNHERACGASTDAVRRYNKGMLASGMAYIFGLGTAMWIWRNMEPSTALTWFLAMLPIVPIFWMIYAMARYIIEEKDEFLRHRAIIASLVGLALVLGVGSFWGFLETFELVPHVPGWWAVPIWALGMGVGQAWQALRDRAEPEQ